MTSIRCVSLVPSATETLLAWGITPVGVTRFCDAPGVACVGGTKDPDTDAIVLLEPDLVVLCDEENRLEDAGSLRAAGLALHVISIRSIADVGPALASLAEGLGVEARMQPLPDAGTMTGGRRRAFIPIWRRPWMTMNRDTYGSSVLAAVGIDNVFSGDTDRYPATTLDAATTLSPDLVLAPSEPYPFGERHRQELEHVAPVQFIDGRDLFWWGVRTPDAIRRLSAALAGR